MLDELVDTKKVFRAMGELKDHIDSMPLNDHEKIIVFKNLTGNELNTMDRKNMAAAIFKALNIQSNID